MEKVIRGKAYVVGDNIDTDQIIPAEYLSYNPADASERKYFGRYAMSGVPIDQAGLPAGGVRFVDNGAFTSKFTVIIGGRNFGCGSSREHAPLAIAQAGVQAVVAQSYARIFYRNSVNGGYALPLETAERLVGLVNTGDEIQIDIPAGIVRDLTTDGSWPLEPLGEVEEIIQAGGIFEYAKKAGML